MLAAARRTSTPTPRSCSLPASLPFPSQKLSLYPPLTQLSLAGLPSLARLHAGPNVRPLLPALPGVTLVE